MDSPKRPRRVPARPERPTLRQLEYFVAVAEQGHFGRAAETCHASQPTISEQLASLEAQLGVQLFERDRRGARATPGARALLPWAQKILAATDALVDAALGLSGELEGTLHVGVIPTIAPYLLPRIVTPLRALRPKLHLVLREDSTERLLAALDAGDLELLLLSLDAELGAVDREELFHEPFLLAVPADHRLASAPEATLRDLDGEALLLLEEAHCLRAQVLSVCQRLSQPHAARETTAFRASSLTTLVEMVAGGLGVTLLPEMAALSLQGREGLAILPLAAEAHGDAAKRADEPTASAAPEHTFDNLPGRSIGLAWRAGSARSEAFRALGHELAKLYMGP